MSDLPARHDQWRHDTANPEATDSAAECYVCVLYAEVDRLTRWKAEATIVIKQWDAMWEAIGRPGALGHSKSEGVRAEVERLTTQNEALSALNLAWATHERKGEPT